VTQLEYHPRASDEVAEAFVWYSEVDPEVAERFKLELDRAERLVQRSPQAWGRYLHDTRGFRFRGFPFVMTYIVRDERIIVVAIAHTRRRPGYWRNRLPSQ
jgi:plasmid stabilization system protein ParE